MPCYALVSGDAQTWLPNSRYSSFFISLAIVDITNTSYILSLKICWQTGTQLEYMQNVHKWKTESSQWTKLLSWCWDYSAIRESIWDVPIAFKDFSDDRRRHSTRVRIFDMQKGSGTAGIAQRLGSVCGGTMEEPISGLLSEAGVKQTSKASKFVHDL